MMERTSWAAGRCPRRSRALAAQVRGLAGGVGGSGEPRRSLPFPWQPRPSRLDLAGGSPVGLAQPHLELPSMETSFKPPRVPSGSAFEAPSSRTQPRLPSTGDTAPPSERLWPLRMGKIRGEGWGRHPRALRAESEQRALVSVKPKGVLHPQHCLPAALLWSIFGHSPVACLRCSKGSSFPFHRDFCVSWELKLGGERSGDYCRHEGLDLCSIPASVGRWGDELRFSCTWGCLGPRGEVKDAAATAGKLPSFPCSAFPVGLFSPLMWPNHSKGR